MRRSPLLLCLVSVALSAAASMEGDSVLTAMAAAYGYPKDRLRIKDLTQSEDVKKIPAVRAAWLIDSSDNTFASVQVAVADLGTVLTPGVQDRFRKALEEQAKIPNSKPNVRILDFGNDIAGYVGILGFGPGGSTTGAVLRIPGKYDVQMTVSLSSETPLGAAPETEAYYQALKTNDDFLKDALGRASQTIANEIVAGRLHFGEDQAAPVLAATPPVTGATSSAAPAATLSPASTPLPAQSVEQVPSPVPAELRSAQWLWWVGLAVVLSLGIVWLVRARK